MAAHVLRLRFDLFVGALRGRPAEVVRRAAAFCVLLLVVGAAGAGVLALAEVTVEVAAVVTVCAAAGVAAGFLVAPLVAGGDDPLDPRRFRVFGPDTGRLLLTLLPAALVSAAALALTAVAVCLAVMWTRHGVPSLAALTGGVLFGLTCLLASKTATAFAALVLRPRRSRELTGLSVVGILVLLVPAVVFAVSVRWDDAVPAELRAVGDVLAVTPLGAAAAIPARIAVGESPVAPVVVAVATIVGLVALWALLAKRLISTTERPPTVRSRGGLGWFTVTPSTAGGAIAARSLTYWLRDSRYLANLIVVPIAGILVTVPLLVVGVPLSIVALVPAPLMALFFGWIVHNDLAYDSTALWMHVASGVRGTADRVGRLVPVLLTAVPVLAVALPVAIAVHGRWALLPALAGVCASLFLCGLGLSSISSAAAPYPASRPGDGPFQQPQRTGGGLAQGAVFVGAIVLSAPVLWWAWRSMSQSISWAWTTLWGGLGIGLAVLVLGVVIGGAVFRRRGTRLMEFAEST